MKKALGVALVAVVVLGLSGAALAWMGGPGGGYGPGMMGWGPGGGYGPGMMGRGGWGPGAGFGPGAGPCRGAYGNQGPTASNAPAAIDDAKAKEIATDYVTKSLPGYTVEKLVKFDGPRGAMYQVEVKGPKDELRYLRINPFGYVIPMGQGRAL